jgi:hypothetical protein
LIQTDSEELVSVSRGIEIAIRIRLLRLSIDAILGAEVAA